MAAIKGFILIKGEPKTLQIESILQDDRRRVWEVRFKNSPKSYHYSYRDLVWLGSPESYDPGECRVFVQGRELSGIASLECYRQGAERHWRVLFADGSAQEHLDGGIRVVRSCLGQQRAKDVFSYLQQIAGVNSLGRSDSSEGILFSQYQKTAFIDDSLAAAPFLNPGRYNPSELHGDYRLIFPFGCNASQQLAVARAFQSQLSVIQGPPGTGKTQTILNIIANILLRGKSVIVVSNNNSATENVLEKLRRQNMGFLAAPLGKVENKEAFISSQPPLPGELESWQCAPEQMNSLLAMVSSALTALKESFSLQEELAEKKLELQSLRLELEHFRRDRSPQAPDATLSPAGSEKLMSLWMGYRAYLEKDPVFGRGALGWLQRIRWWWINLTRKPRLGISSPFDRKDPLPVILELQSAYYLARQEELSSRILEIEERLGQINAQESTEVLVQASMRVLQGKLFEKYSGRQRISLSDVKDIRRYASRIQQDYPVVTSTTFSARSSLSESVAYDYLIMDEASQVSVETGALALSCARNAVIVGDSMQLPNVVAAADKKRCREIFESFDLDAGYDCSCNSFLESLCAILPSVPTTLLREHYRCHPKIINFCNRKFYGGKLLIMTKDSGEEDAMTAFRTLPGNHSREHYNQREIDVIKQEVLPRLGECSDIGIISPYVRQAAEAARQLPQTEAATVHKFQGREKDTIIFSVADDQITCFSDDANLLNVAVSRAKKRFCIVLSGNPQKLKGNIADLVDYIEYNNFAVTESKISSIFDYLYTGYTRQRIEFLKNHPKISEYDSENLTFALLQKILGSRQEFSHLGVLCHVPMQSVIKDFSLMNDAEKSFASNLNTHFDFLIVNRVNRRPVMVIETDGYSFHNKKTRQHSRDLKKDHILELYRLPLLRLSTVGSGEEERITAALSEACQNSADHE